MANENRLAEIEKQRQALIDRYKVDDEDKFIPNPSYKSDIFDANSYLSVIPKDPAAAQPLPTGRAITPSIPSDLNAIRIANSKAFLGNPEQYFKDNTMLQNNEQSLLDKGKSMMAKIFDYRDEADLSLFGMNISGVESVFDGFTRHFVGGYDLLNVGMGALVSAAPGGIRTLEFSELTGGKGLGEVLSGEMEPGDAPSVGQIAIASIAIESKRIREGKARLSDVLLANPATAPFILAGIAAKDSPLQQEGFDIMDKEQREKAFGSGYEQWFSGITDAGLMLADPLIGAGYGAKIVRAGLLGTKSGPIGAAMRETANARAVRLLDETHAPAGVDSLAQIDAMAARGEALASGRMAPGTANLGATQPTVDLPTIDSARPRPEKDPIAQFLYDLHEVNADGVRKLSVTDIAARTEFKGTTKGMTIASLLHRSRSYAESALILDVIGGTANSRRKLELMSPALSDEVHRMMRADNYLQAIGEPQKLDEVRQSLGASVQELDSQITAKEKILGEMESKATAAGKRASDDPSYFALYQDVARIKKSRGQAVELQDDLIKGEPPDILDPTSAFYDRDRAYALIDDLQSRNKFYKEIIDSNIQGESRLAGTGFITKTNLVARSVSESRKRRALAASQYAQEGTSIFPKGGTGWFSPSQFEGVSPFQRNIRVWRWFGSEKPVGLIGLHGTATVGADRELLAATDLEIFKSPKPISVKIDVLDEKGAFKRDPITNEKIQETVLVGGQEMRQRLIAKFAAALNDPNADNFKVLQEIELEIATDLARLHNLDVKSMEKIMSTANNDRLANVDLLREKAMFVDPIDKTIHHIPLGPEQLANSTYMQNFQAMEKLLNKKSRDPGAMTTLRTAMETGGQYGQDAYKLFNDVWRPATLLRISYMNRNVVDGMVRAMAYQGSLVPMMWPVQAAFFGVRNKLVSNVVGRRVARGEKAVDQSEYGLMYREFTDANSELSQLISAQKADDIVVDGKDPVPAVTIRVAAPEGGHRAEVIPLEDYKVRLEDAGGRVDALRGRMEANLAKYDAAVEGTRFGDWRKKNIEDLKRRVDDHRAFMDQVHDVLEGGLPDGGKMALLPAETDTLSKLISASTVDEIKLHDLMYIPTTGQRMYREVAGRARRIGSGTSIGPRGSYYDDAFAGPFEQLNRAMLSADNTVKMQLSLRGDVWSSLFRRSILHNRDYVEWNPRAKNNLDQWASAQATVLERASANALVRYMVLNGWNEDKALVWLVSDPAGKDFYTQVSKMFAENGASLSPTRIDPFAKEAQLPTGESMTMFDTDEARKFIQDTTRMYRAQLQNSTGFEQILEYRVKAKAGGSVGVQAISGDDIKQVIAAMSPEERSRLGAVQGSELIDAGTDGARNAWTKFVSKAFGMLGTIPEDALTRGPFYNARFKEARNELISMYWEEMPTNPRAGRGAFGAGGRDQAGTLAHAEFKIPANRWAEIQTTAHRRALATTREYMYTIERQTNLGKYGEWLFPFITAQQNTLTVAGKLLNRNPWLAPLIVDVWRMPDRLGVEDEDGNLSLPMPVPWVTDFLKDNPNIPVIGGILDSNDMLTIPKNGVNVWFADSGFGIVPRPAAWAQVGASELMKWGLFPVETPEIFRKLLPNQDDPENPYRDADEMYQTIKDWVFGEDSGMSSDPLSLDKLIPAWAQKAYYSRKELSTQYGYKFAIQWHTQMMRYRANERDEMPTPAEINKRVTNAFWFDLFGNQGVPTPITPYPIVTRPVINSPVEFGQDILRMYAQVDPVNASANAALQLGDWILDVGNTKVTKNVGGGDPVPETISDIKTFDALLRVASSSVPEANLDVLGLIINNRASSVDYEKSAYEWQTSAAIPGSNRLFREVQSPDQSILERQRIVGWTKYRMAMDKYDARLTSMGLSSYEVKAASELKAAKDQFTRSMLLDPELKGWAIDYQDIGGARAGSAIRVMELAVNDETFIGEMSKEDKTLSVLNIMRDYTDNRRILVQLLKDSGHNIDHEDNVLLKQAWANMRQGWKNSSVRWAEIADLYLSSDDNPTNPGSVIPELMQSPVASLSGVSNG